MMRFLIYSCLLYAIVRAQEEAGGGDPDEKVKIAHAVLGSTAYVFFLPLGAILVRILSAPTAVYAHAGIQSFSVALLIANAGLGIWMALDKAEISAYHCIIGLVLFSLLFFQAAGGIIQHLSYRKYGRRTFLSHVHVWMGRALITLGMINGGFGLQLSADATRGEYIAYGVVAAFMWLLWVMVDFGVLFKTRREPKSVVDEKN